MMLLSRLYKWSAGMMENITNYETLGTCELDGYCKTYYARKKGRSHAGNNTVCQDYCLVENIDDETQVVCVADGHGGEAYTKSDKGSYYACTVFLNLIKNIKNNSKKTNNEDLWTEVLKTSDFKKEYIKQWKQAVLSDYNMDNNINESDQVIIKKYGTTFLFTIYAKDKYIVGQLGDGAILLSNGSAQNQLFKRHVVKTSPATSSMASGRAEYAFLIDSFDVKCFSGVLLSTDGIYDKLDNDDSFSLYENSLINQIEQEGELKRPFEVQGMDVSEISKDDCTIAIIKNNENSANIMTDGLESKGIKNIKFLRNMNGLTIFTGDYNEKKVEIHLVYKTNDEIKTNMESVAILYAEQIIKLDDGCQAYIYKIPDNYHRVAMLVDSGEHLEKKYWFNESETGTEDEIQSGGKYSNEYWLRVYEQLISLKDEIKNSDITTHGYLAECLFVTDKGKLIVLSDAFYKCGKKTENVAMGQLLSRFSIFGSLSCGDVKIPLFETTLQGQNISLLHTVSERKPLCRVIYNPEKKILGLWNAMDSSWNVENEKRKEIPVKGVLRLNKNHTFYVIPDDMEKNPAAEFTDGYAKYKIKILRR